MDKESECESHSHQQCEKGVDASTKQNEKRKPNCLFSSPDYLKFQRVDWIWKAHKHDIISKTLLRYIIKKLLLLHVHFVRAESGARKRFNNKMKSHMTLQTKALGNVIIVTIEIDYTPQKSYLNLSPKTMYFLFFFFFNRHTFPCPWKH